MSECNHKFEGWNEDDIEVCVICEKPTAEIAHALQQQLDACKAENERLKKERAEQHQRAQYYRTVLQEIRDNTPAGQAQNWPHHHWYLHKATEAINHAALGDDDE